MTNTNKSREEESVDFIKCSTCGNGYDENGVCQNCDEPKEDEVNRYWKARYQESNWEEEFDKKFPKEIFMCKLQTDALLMKVLIKDSISKLRTQSREEERQATREKLESWYNMQMERWDEDTQFRSGVKSAYGWMKGHIPHILSGEKCQCPKVSLFLLNYLDK